MTFEGSRLRSVFRVVTPFLVLFGTLFVLIWPTVEGIVSRWFKFDESYSHGFLLLLVSVALTIRTAKRTSPVLGFYPLWLVPFALALIAYGLGDVLRLQALGEVTVVPLLLGALAILLGWQQVRAFIIPLGVLFFTVPVWDYLSWPLQLITVEINRLLLGLFDIDFEVEGVFVYLIGVGTFEVAHGCSGLRYLLVGQSIAALYGELNFRCVRSRIVFFLFAVALALLANWIRVFVIIYMGYETNMETSLIKDHDNFGWWVFAATLVPLFFIGRKLEMTGIEQHAVATDAESGSQKAGRRWVGTMVAASLPLLVFALLPNSEGHVRVEPERFGIPFDNSRYAPLFGNDLKGWRPKVRNPDVMSVHTLFDRQNVAEGRGPDKSLFIGVYGYEYQRHRAELIQYWNRLYERDQWVPERFFRLTSPGGVQLQGLRLKGPLADESIHIAYGYYVEGVWETDQLRAKLAQVSGFFNTRSDASLVVFGVACEHCNGEEALAELVNNTMPAIVRQIDQRFVGQALPN